MRITVAQLGARMHYAVPRIFHEAGMLERLFTDSYIGNKPWLEAGLKAIPESIRPRYFDSWLGRKESQIPPEKVISFGRLGIAYVLAQRRARSASDRWRVYRKYGARFQEAVIRKGLGDAMAVYVMTGAADRLISYATSRGISSIMEQFDHTVRWRLALQHDEMDRWGSDPNGASLLDEAEVAEVRAREEIAIRKANLVIVASDYTRRTMAHDGYETEKVRIVPYGIDLNRWSTHRSLSERPPGPLRVLYVGSVDLRKGILYLLEALKRLGTTNIEFRAAGGIALDLSLLGSYVDRKCFLGPVPRTRVQELFHWADMFVFPTLGEGFGMVQVEAIATGTPVIATTECGEVIREGVEGHLVPPRDPDAIANWLDYYATNPSRLEPLRAAALERAGSFSIDGYAARLLDAVNELRETSRSTRAIE